MATRPATAAATVVAAARKLAASHPSPGAEAVFFLKKKDPTRLLERMGSSTITAQCVPLLAGDHVVVLGIAVLVVAGPVTVGTEPGLRRHGAQGDRGRQRVVVAPAVEVTHVRPVRRVRGRHLLERVVVGVDAGVAVVVEAVADLAAAGLLGSADVIAVVLDGGELRREAGVTLAGVVQDLRATRGVAVDVREDHGRGLVLVDETVTVVVDIVVADVDPAGTGEVRVDVRVLVVAVVTGLRESPAAVLGVAGGLAPLARDERVAVAIRVVVLVVQVRRLARLGADRRDHHHDEHERRRAVPGRGGHRVVAVRVVAHPPRTGPEFRRAQIAAEEAHGRVAEAVGVGVFVVGGRTGAEADELVGVDEAVAVVVDRVADLFGAGVDELAPVVAVAILGDRFRRVLVVARAGVVRDLGAAEAVAVVVVVDRNGTLVHQPIAVVVPVVVADLGRVRVDVRVVVVAVTVEDGPEAALGLRARDDRSGEDGVPVAVGITVAVPGEVSVRGVVSRAGAVLVELVAADVYRARADRGVGVVAVVRARRVARARIETGLERRARVAVPVPVHVRVVRLATRRTVVDDAVAILVDAVTHLSPTGLDAAIAVVAVVVVLDVASRLRILADPDVRVAVLVAVGITPERLLRSRAAVALELVLVAPTAAQESSFPTPGDHQAHDERDRPQRTHTHEAPLHSATDKPVAVTGSRSIARDLLKIYLTLAN